MPLVPTRHSQKACSFEQEDAVAVAACSVVVVVLVVCDVVADTGDEGSDDGTDGNSKPYQPNPAQKCTLLEVLQFSISRVRSGTVIFQVLKGIMGLNLESRVMSSQ